jgi:hypothetical protein
VLKAQISPVVVSRVIAGETFCVARRGGVGEKGRGRQLERLLSPTRSFAVLLHNKDKETSLEGEDAASAHIYKQLSQQRNA